MTMFSTLCTVSGGKLKLLERESFNEGLARFCDGEEIELTLETVAAKHTSAQRKFFHGPVLKPFIKHGWQRQEAKDMLAMRHIPQEVRMLDGTIIRMPGHTSALSRAAYNEFIEACIQDAATELCEVVDDADEWRRKQRRNPLSDAYAEGLQIGADIAAAMKSEAE